MSRSAHRGASWAGGGEGVIAQAQDRRALVDATPSDDDTMTLAGAQALRRRIEAYWTGRGQRVQCRIERGLFGTWVVRSRLVNGRPRADASAEARDG